MTDETTPRPWRVGLHPCDDWTIYSPNGEKVAFNVNGSISDAALIVRAVNAHDDLVEALTTLLRYYPYQNSVYADNARYALRAVRETLK